MNRLGGRVALVTGGGSGIGRAIAEAFASEGAAVAVLDLDRDAAEATAVRIASNGGKAVAVGGDVAVAADADRAVERCAAELGGLDVLVNNAGVGMLGTVEELDEDTWNRVLAVNLTSIFLLARRAIPLMAAAGGGRIINVASVAGLVASPGRAAYCASKGGVVMLTRAMALDCANQGINVNAICPGVVVTGMTEGSLEDPSTRKEKLDKTPLGRLGKPTDIAPAAVYLASNDADFVTGACLVVDGGWSID